MLKERLKADLKQAMRDKDIIKRDSIRAINTMIKQIEVDKRVSLDDEEIIKLIKKGIKQREESAKQYKEANRDDLAEKELNEIEIFKNYLPKQLTKDELRAKLEEIIKRVDAKTPKDMGKVMGIATKELSSVADGKMIANITKELLNG